MLARRTRSLLTLRHGASHSVTTTLTRSTASQPDHTNQQDTTTIPDFSDTKEAFRCKTSSDLFRAYLVYKMFSYSSIVNNSDKLMKLSRKMLGEKYFNKLMKATVYGQFVAGDDLSTLRPVIKHYRDQGVRSILDYAVEDDVPSDDDVYLEIRSRKLPQQQKQENDPASRDTITPPSPTRRTKTHRASARTYFYEDEKKCDQNMENFVKCISTAADVSDGDTSFAAIKLTGLGRTEFLLRLSDSLNGSQRLFTILSDDGTIDGAVTMDTIASGLANMKVEVSQSDIERMFRELDHTHSGTLDMFQWTNNFQPNTQLYKILSRKKWSELQPTLPVMTEIERDQMISMIKRTEVLSQCASDRGVRIMVDAEQTYLQPAIRHIAVNILMPKYNLVSPVVYNTQQCYLKGVYDSIMLDMAMADRVGFHYGVKLVRGAYMEQERERAIEKGYNDPIWDSKAATDASYHKVLDEVLGRVSEGRTSVMVATHNEDSVLYAIRRMKELRLSNDSGVVFGQLMGMCDHVTFQLGSLGYMAYKYMPYGPVHEVLPYLQRRAHENKGFIKGATRERYLIAREIKRRIAKI